jgi:AcrR family transcriptional regulator
MSFRDEKRRRTMREIQSAALDLFEARGYDAVSVEAIAAAAGVSAPTVYRNFGTKERIVLWDDYDPDMLDAIAAETRRAKPLAAIEIGLVGALDRIYEADARRVFRRSKLAVKEPALRLANAPALAEMRAQLGAVLVLSYAGMSEARADLLAAVVVVALEIAVNRWIQEQGREPLRTYFREVFADLRSLVLTEGVTA